MAGKAAGPALSEFRPICQMIEWLHMDAGRLTPWSSGNSRWTADRQLPVQPQIDGILKFRVFLSVASPRRRTGLAAAPGARLWAAAVRRARRGNARLPVRATWR